MSTITSLGIGSGLDLNGLLTQLNESERSRLKPIEQKITQEESKISGYGKFKSALSELSDASDRLSDAQTFNQKGVDVDGESVYASVDNNATDARYDIDVTQLATRGNVASNSFGSKINSIGNTATELTISFSEKEDVVINIDANSSLEDINKKINDNVEGVTSSIIFDGDGYRLAVSSENTGSQESVSGLSIQDTMTTEVANIGENATFTANGVTITNPSNTVDNSIEGLSINLTDLGRSVITIENDDELIKEALTDFVDKYNSFKDTVDSLTSFDIESGMSGSLNGEYTVRNVSNNISRMLSSTTGTGEMNMLADLGISNTSDGRLEIDEDRLNGQIASNKDSVMDFLTNEDYGFANKIGSMLDSNLNSNGVVNNAITNSENRIDGLRSQYTRYEENIETSINRYRTQFEQLDSMIAQMSQTSSYLSQQLGMLNQSNN